MPDGNDGADEPGIIDLINGAVIADAEQELEQSLRLYMY